jgi:hypothetical protein
MNKKLIAIAIATVMAAPVAMADIKISGRVGGHLVSTDTDGAADANVGFDDNGQTRLQFDGTMGNAYARIALDRRLSKNNTDSPYTDQNRDNYLGYKFGGGMSAQFGRMPTAGKNIEKDPYIATFLQIRKTVAESATASNYGSSSFVDHVAQLKMKAGAANVTVQYDVGSKSTYSPNEGHLAIAVTGKGGPVNYWFAYNNGSADGPGGSTPGNDDSNIKFGGSMKFGAIKASLNFTSSDNDGTESDSILLMADMGLGGGLSANFSYATRDAAEDATWMRLAVAKKLNKGVMVYAGYTTTDYDGATADFTKIGAGMTVKF